MPNQMSAKKQTKFVGESAERLEFFRKRRDDKLTACDWTQLPDAPLTAEQKAAWAIYRQALRDVPATADANGWVTWPKKPS